MTNQITPTSVLIINRLSDAARADDFGFELKSQYSFFDYEEEGKPITECCSWFRVSELVFDDDFWSITLNDNPDSPNYWNRMLPMEGDAFGREGRLPNDWPEADVLMDSGNVEWARAHMHEGWRILARPLNGRLTGWFDYTIQEEVQNDINVPR